jgi:hypothetical protein
MILNPIKIAETIIDNGQLEKVLVKQGVYDCCVLWINKQMISFRYDYEMNPRIESAMVWVDGDDLNITVEENIMIRHLLISKFDSKAWSLIKPIERIETKKQR